MPAASIRSRPGCCRSASATRRKVSARFLLEAGRLIALRRASASRPTPATPRRGHRARRVPHPTARRSRRRAGAVSGRADRRSRPMYSALKHGGRRLYELARAGVVVEREPRRDDDLRARARALRAPRRWSSTCAARRAPTCARSWSTSPPRSERGTRRAAAPRGRRAVRRRADADARGAVRWPGAARHCRGSGRAAAPRRIGRCLSWARASRSSAAAATQSERAAKADRPGRFRRLGPRGTGERPASYSSASAEATPGGAWCRGPSSPPDAWSEYRFAFVE